ncbi:MAG: LysR substrate-binding domain-containing protein, partial [Halioglobus sp.]
MRRLPPLNSLRAFESAARHLSFSKAADELSVTPAAISQQVKILEDYFACPLFQRQARGLRLTDIGAYLVPHTSDAFDQLNHAVRSARIRNESSILTVSVSSSFGANWLVPRLDSFRREHPDFDIRLDATDRLIDFEREDVDLAIRYGAGNYRCLVSECLLQNSTIPVCSPTLNKGKHPIKTPDDLRFHTLLHTEWSSASDTAPHWPSWLRAAGVKIKNADRGPRFSSEGM